MCGLSGIISNTAISCKYLNDSLQSIKHRGPDNTLITDTNAFFASSLSNRTTQQTYSKSENIKSKIWIGFNRLSIVDFSQNAMQPFYDEQTDCFFMLNGEIFNYQQLKTEHLSNTPFFSKSDSEVAFKMYLKYGNSFIQYLQGMFTIVIYDKQNQKVKIWRDRLGIKPLYYYHNGEYFIFSSEIKGIFETNLITKSPNFLGIAYSMYLGTCPSPLTIYNQISSLQAGHYLEYCCLAKRIKIEAYWHLEYNPSSKIIKYEEFADDVEQLCQLYDTAENEKAIMLSGGIDSGTLAYFFAKNNSEIKAFTIYQSNSYNNELTFSIDNAKNAGLQLTSFEIPSDVDNKVKTHYISSEEEPNFIPEPALFLSKKAKEQNVKILYNALGPDEIFGGYDYFRKIKKLKNISWLFSFIPSFLIPENKNQKIKELTKYGIQNLVFTSRSKFSWKEIISFLQKNNQPIPIHPIAFIHKQVVDLYPEFENLPILKKASYLDIFYYIASHHTMRSDVPSMIYSIEMRFPFLEHTFIEKYFNQPDLFDDLNKELKPKIRQFAKKYLSSKVLNMPKKGFSIDVSQWLEEKKAQKNWYWMGLHDKFPSLKSKNYPF